MPGLSSWLSASETSWGAMTDLASEYVLHLNRKWSAISRAIPQSQMGESLPVLKLILQHCITKKHSSKKRHYHDHQEGSNSRYQLTCVETSTVTLPLPLPGVVCNFCWYLQGTVHRYTWFCWVLWKCPQTYPWLTYQLIAVFVIHVRQTSAPIPVRSSNNITFIGPKHD